MHSNTILTSLYFSKSINVLYYVFKKLEIKSFFCFMKALSKQQKVITTQKQLNKLTKINTNCAPTLLGVLKQHLRHQSSNDIMSYP